MRSIFVLSLLVAAACSSTTSNGGSTATGPQKACEDTAAAVAKAAQRCGADYQMSYDQFTNAIGGCANIVQVRDEASLRSTCIPSLSTISCTDFMNGNLDASCKSQLLKAKAYEPPVHEVVTDVAAIVSEPLPY